MGRPNRGTGSAGPKRPNNGGNKEQYSAGGSKPTKTSSMNERYEDDDYEDDDWNERYGNRGGRSGGSRVGMRRSRGGGRYSRY